MPTVDLTSTAATTSAATATADANTSNNSSNTSDTNNNKNNAVVPKKLAGSVANAANTAATEPESEPILVRVAIEPTAALLISRSVYTSLLKASVAKDLAEKFVFLQSVHVLGCCTLRQLLSIAQRLEKIEASRHAVVCRQGEVPNAVYFVKEGSVRVVQRVALTSSNNKSSVNNSGNSARAKPSSSNARRGSNSSSTPTTPAASTVADGANISQHQQQQHQGQLALEPEEEKRGKDFELVDLGEVGEGWHFGEFAILRQTVRH